MIVVFIELQSQTKIDKTDSASVFISTLEKELLQADGMIHTQTYKTTDKSQPFLLTYWASEESYDQWLKRAKNRFKQQKKIFAAFSGCTFTMAAPLRYYNGEGQPLSALAFSQSIGEKNYRLMDGNGNFYYTPLPGCLGGYKRRKIYGRLDCKSAASAIAKGGYVAHRIFFKDEQTAIQAGFRLCAKCMPEEYAKWKNTSK